MKVTSLINGQGEILNHSSKNGKLDVFFRFIDDNQDSLRFVGVAVFIFAVLQLLYFQFYVGSSLFYSYLRLCAELSTQLLLLIGEPVTLAARTITSDAGPAVTVVEGCDALRIYSVLVAAIVAFQSPWPKKIVGILVGVGSMFVFNLIRISLLLWLDVHHTDWFDTFHHTILPFGLWLIAVVYFYLWCASVDLSRE